MLDDLNKISEGLLRAGFKKIDRDTFRKVIKVNRLSTVTMNAEIIPCRATGYAYKVKYTTDMNLVCRPQQVHTASKMLVEKQEALRDLLPKADKDPQMQPIKA